MSELDKFVSALGILIGLLGLIGYMGICIAHIINRWTRHDQS